MVPSDPALADAVFEAGLKLVQEIGGYSRTTERIIEFETGELETGLRAMPQQLEMGEGKDVRTLVARRITDDRPPIDGHPIDGPVGFRLTPFSFIY